jgi:hypothetical protein
VTDLQKPAAWRCGLFLFFIGLAAGARAEAAMRVNLYGLADRANLSYASSPDQPLWGWGGGASLEFSLGTRTALELGATWIGRRLSDTTVSPALNSTYSFLQVPVLLRLSLAPFLSLGVGGYYGNAVGSIHTDGAGATAYQDAGLRRSDYGLVGSFRCLIRPGKTLSPFLEGRYSYGLSDSLDHPVADALDPVLSNQKAHWQDIQILIGLQI